MPDEGIIKVVLYADDDLNEIFFYTIVRPLLYYSATFSILKDDLIHIFLSPRARHHYDPSLC